MTVRLAVAGAFHTDFMAPARERLQEALASTNILVGGEGVGAGVWRERLVGGAGRHQHQCAVCAPGGV